MAEEGEQIKNYSEKFLPKSSLLIDIQGKYGSLQLPRLASYRKAASECHAIFLHCVHDFWLIHFIFMFLVICEEAIHSWFSVCS